MQPGGLGRVRPDLLNLLMTSRLGIVHQSPRTSQGSTVGNPSLQRAVVVCKETKEFA